MARIKPPDLSHLAHPGATIEVKVTPRARQAMVEETPEGLRVSVREPPEDGRANAAVQAALAKALGVAKTRLTLVRGATSRIKTFRID